MIHTHSIADNELTEALEKGLSAHHKYLPSWLFYDARGDQIFQKIMNLSSYYPTKCEYEIIQLHKADILHYLRPFNEPFDFIELGAGDGLKTEVIIRFLYEQQIKFTYRPVDISGSILDQLTLRLKNRYAGIDVQPMNENYFEALQQLDRSKRKVVFFLGANIGNFTLPESLHFLKNITSQLSPRDFAFVGFDLKKDPRIIEKAYDDDEGVTREFNLNILQRLNNEAGAKFVLREFDHYASYDPESGAARSYLVSLKDQDVFIGRLNKTFHFAQWETINTEISQKYDLLTVERMLSDSGLEIVDLFFDSQHYFCDVLVKKNR